MKHILAAAGLVLSITPCHAAVSVTLDCHLEENGDGKVREVFALDYDARTVRKYYVDYLGDRYRYGTSGDDITYPAQIGGKDIRWTDKDGSYSAEYVLRHRPSGWMIVAHYSGQPKPETATCDIWE